MQSFAFDGSYEDDRGREALRWEIVPCTRYGPRMPVVEIRTVIRGVPVWGTDFDMLSADDPDASRAASLAGDPDDMLEGCVLAGDLPVVFDVSGQRQDGVVRFTLDLRFGPGHPREDPKNLTLTMRGVTIHNPENPGQCDSATVTERTDGATVTVPVFSSTVPVLACAMLPTNAGSWNSTGPEG